MKVSEAQTSFIEANLHLATGKTTSGIIEALDNDLLSIILWNPLSDKDVTLYCPNHGTEKLGDTGAWTKEGEWRPPRLLYHVGQNVLLVSAVYKCTTCGGKSTYLATHPDVLTQLPHNKAPPFHIFLKSGITRAGYEMIVNAALSGTSFLQISAMFQRSHGFHAGLHGQGQSGEKHSSPSRDFIRDVFMYDYRLRLSFYEATMKGILFTDLSIDHTFYIR